jgi:histidine triad (HIT) family protein
MASIFTKIINREIPADIVYEDELVIALLDINPVNDGHTLVVPKEEYADFSSIPPELLGPFFERVQRIARGVTAGVRADGFNVLLNTGSAAGQEVMHVHAHIIPRFEGDGYEHWHGSGYDTEDEKKRTAERIRNALDA